MFPLFHQLLGQRIAQQVRALKEVQYYLGQDQQQGEIPLLTSPAAYLQYQPIDFQTLPRENQLGNARFTVRVVSDCIYDNDQRVESMLNTHWTLVGQVYKALMGYPARKSALPAFASLAGTQADHQVFSEIVRLRLQPDHRPSNLIVTLIEFETTLYDCSAFDLALLEATPSLCLFTDPAPSPSPQS
jgi:hypothetical protein